MVNVVDKLKSLAAGGLGSIDAYCATIPASIRFVQSKLPDGLRLIPPSKWAEMASDRAAYSAARVMSARVSSRLAASTITSFSNAFPMSPVATPTRPPAVLSPTCLTLLLDQPLAVAVGINLYGFNKRTARISSKDGAFVVRGDLSEIRANFYGHGLPGTADKTSSISGCSRFLGQPFISQKPTGEWVYSYLDYRLESATYQRVHGVIDIGEPFVDKSNPVVYKDGLLHSGTLEVAPFEAEHIVWFRFSSQWRLSMPLTSGQTSDTSAGGQIRSTVSEWTGSRLGRFLQR